MLEKVFDLPKGFFLREAEDVAILFYKENGRAYEIKSFSVSGDAPELVKKVAKEHLIKPNNEKRRLMICQKK